METSAHSSRTVRFGVFELDVRAAELRKHGVRIHLQEQPFHVLMLLLESPGELVTREELRQKLWSADTFVDFDRNLNKAMNKLRLALGDSAESPRFIETLHRRGYRFIAPVKIEETAMATAAPQPAKVQGNLALSYVESLETLPPPALPAPVSKPSLRRPISSYFVVFVLIALAAVSYFAFRVSSVRQISAAPVTPRRSVAVLRFKNLSGRADQAWLSTALSDWLSTELSAGDQLRTIPGESVARMKIELAIPDVDNLDRDTLIHIGKNLGTDLVVVGSYASLGKDAGGLVRLDLRLEDTRTGESLDAISETGTEARLFDLVSQAGAHLRSTLGIEAVTRQEAAEVAVALPSNHEAARLYSEGLAKLRIFDALAARDLLQQAIRIEPNYALAHSALATAWSALGYDDMAAGEAKRAFELSSNLPRSDRLLVQGRYYEISKNWDKATDIYRALFAFYPDSLDYGLALANAQISGGRGSDAIFTTEDLKKLPPPLGDDARIDMAEARAAESLGDFRRDLASTTRAAQKAQSVGASLLVAPALSDEAWALINLGRADEAPAVVDQAQKIFQAAGDQRGVARTANLIGIVLQSQGDAVGARRHYEQGLAVYRKLGNKKGVADELDNLGDVLFALGELQAARQSYEQSIAADAEIGNQDGTALAKGALGPVLLALGDHEGAKKTSQESLEICQRIGDRSKAAIALAGVGNALRSEGKLEDSQSYEDRAVAMFNDIGDKQSAARFQLSVAQLLLDRGNAAKAAEIASHSAEEFQREKAVRDEAFADALLARAFLVQHDGARANAALGSATSLSGKYHDRGVELFVELTTAVAQAASDHVEDHNQVQKTLHNVIAEATKDGFAEYALEARLALARIQLTSNTSDARSRLEALRTEAANKGLSLIAQQAGTALASTH